jgi:hypothetical protein
VGVFVLLAICLGSLFFTMLFQAMNAYWPVTLRRQMEHAAGLIWLPLLGMLAVIVIELLSSVFTGHGVLFQWLDENQGYLLDHKDGYLNLGFLLVRFVIYGAIWLFLARSILSMSLEQDATGEPAAHRRDPPPRVVGPARLRALGRLRGLRLPDEPRLPVLQHDVGRLLLRRRGDERPRVTAPSPSACSA